MERLGAGKRCDGIAYRDIRSARKRNDIAHLRLGDRHTLESVYLIYRNDPYALGGGVGVIVADERVLILLYGAALDTADTYSSDVIVVVDGGNQKLKIVVRVALGRGNVIEDGFKQRCEVGPLLIRRERRGAVTSGAEDHGAVKLLIGGVEIHKKLKYLLLDLLDAGVGLIDLIYHDDNGMIQLKRALKNKTGLRHGTLGCIYKQKHAVDHFKHTLDLAAEVGVTGGVNYVDLYALVMYSGVFGQNGNAALTLDIARVHDAGAHFLIVTENTALLKHLVDQGGFAVVNVCDNGNVS